ncbi:hypothetical protein AAG906_019056 [Vitis piasezkii]
MRKRQEGEIGFFRNRSDLSFHNPMISIHVLSKSPQINYYSKLMVLARLLEVKSIRNQSTNCQGHSDVSHDSKSSSKKTYALNSECD